LTVKYIDMDPAKFHSTVVWVTQASYLLIFIAMFIEGPIITIAAAFASALGFLNIFIILGLSLLGDIGADTLYFAIGYYGRTKFIEKYNIFRKLESKRTIELEKLLKNNPIKTLVVIKLTPFLPTPGLIVAGGIKIPAKLFFLVSILIGVPKSILFCALGYYIGEAHLAILNYFKTGPYTIIISIAVIIILFLVFQKLATFIAKKVEST